VFRERESERDLGASLDAVLLHLDRGIDRLLTVWFYIFYIYIWGLFEFV